MIQLENIIYSPNPHPPRGRDEDSPPPHRRSGGGPLRPGPPRGGPNPEQLFAAGWTQSIFPPG